MSYRSSMRLSRFCLLLCLLCLCAFATRIYSQSKPSPVISFAGAPNYSQAELLAFTGLKPGTTQQQMDTAAQRLGDTGLFDEVNFAGNNKGIVYTLKPAKATLPARFSNFVWWQDDEINSILKSRVALYRSSAVPTSGNLRDSICAALAAMLAEKGVTGASVSSVPSSLRAGAPVDHLVFNIDSPAVLVHSLILAGASPSMQPKLAAILHDMAGQPWDKDTSFSNIAGRVSDVYRNVGYLDIALAKQEQSTPTVTAKDISLDLTASINEGAQYHVTQLTWAGSEFLSSVEFNKQAKLRPGDPDSPLALYESLRSLADAYGAKGYIDAKILAPPVIDRNVHQVAYTVSVEPGPQYRLKAVHFPGLSDELTKLLESDWKLRPGDIYDSTYFTKFINQHLVLLRKGGFSKFNSAEKRDSTGLTVDLTVTLAKAEASKLN